MKQRLTPSLNWFWAPLFIHFALCAQLAHAQAQSSEAEHYPQRPVHLVVPFPPGGGNDFIARFIAQRLSSSLKQSVIVDNKAGAGGLMGNEYAIKSPADGYTLLLVSASYTVNAALYPLKYDPVQDVSAIAQLSQGAFVLVANPNLAVKNVSELVALAKARPGELTIASSGQGSILHLSAELLMSQASIHLLHVPYKGGGPALSDTLSGQTQLFFSTPSVALPFIKSGKLKALGVSTKERTPVLPEVPSLRESGLPQYEVNVWHGILSPKGTPKAIITRLNTEINLAMNSKEAQELLEKDGVYPVSGTPEQFQGLIKNETSLWQDVVKKSKITLDP
jgi:tripartite-type tricarboxylate transporter receptor subunit TctC